MVWPVFLLLGIEQVRIDPGNTAFTPLDFVHYPWTHSLVAAIAWSVLFFLVFARKGKREAAILGLLLSRIPAKRRKIVLKGPVVRNNEVQKAGRAAFLLGALKIVLDLAKPALLSWGKSRFFNGSSFRRPSN